MKPLRIANDKLGDVAALERSLEADGYLFFKKVLDKSAIDTLKAAYLAELDRQGLIDGTASEPIWRSDAPDPFPARMERLQKSDLWRSFVKTPEIDRFFGALFGEQPSWLPIVVYRAVPPAPMPQAVHLAGVHQDGFYNEGLEFLVCWIPLMEIDSNIGGLVVAEGQHKRGYLHDLNAPPRHEIPIDAIDPLLWRNAHYQAGDIVIFDKLTPHTGLPNRSDRVRLSIDLRLMRADFIHPVIGERVAASSGSIAVRAETGVRSFLINDETYFRGQSRARGVSSDLPIGSRIMVVSDGTRATLVRPA